MKHKSVTKINELCGQLWEDTVSKQRKGGFTWFLGSQVSSNPGQPNFQFCFEKELSETSDLTDWRKGPRSSCQDLINHKVRPDNVLSPPYTASHSLVEMM